MSFEVITIKKLTPDKNWVHYLESVDDTGRFSITTARRQLKALQRCDPKHTFGIFVDDEFCDPEPWHGC